ncbi:polyketide cyclase/dehydrase [Aureibaculum marinum]|uniref:Polyketide cyclase/dehydrase n=1 Tax=Aureibaculum marinum TaxID=2487930 RepID=A0A3N4NY45_9FLAO|nr:SRPBCC family protein [Aureibaculum marinum]RPD99138.1 polyketide cyclase/dehydrase [Aureibaculum marinum]
MTINQEAPVIQSKEIVINATPEKVWQILTNIDGWSEWNERIQQSSLKGGLKVGNIFTWKTNGSKIKSKIHTTIPNKMLGWEGKTFGARAIHNWFLQPTENGTKVSVEESMEGWIINLIKKKMNLKLADDMTHWLEKLKAEIEKSNTTNNTIDVVT